METYILGDLLDFIVVKVLGLVGTKGGVRCEREGERGGREREMVKRERKREKERERERKREKREIGRANEKRAKTAGEGRYIQSWRYR